MTMPTHQEISTAADVLLALAEREDSLDGARSMLGAARRVLSLREPSTSPPAPPHPTEPRRRGGKPAGRSANGPGRAEVVAAVERGAATAAEVAAAVGIDSAKASEFLRRAQKQKQIRRLKKGRYAPLPSSTHPAP